MALNLSAMREMTREQWDEHIAELKVFAAQLGAEHKARREAVRLAAQQSARRPRGKPSICMVMALHQRLPNGIAVSLEGNEARTVKLYDKAGIVIEGAAGDWIAVTMPKWLRADRGLFGAAPLTETNDDRAAMVTLANEVNARLNPPRIRLVQRDKIDRGSTSFSPW